MMKTSTIAIKGIREGILVALDEALSNDAYEEVVQQLDAELADRESFLKGSRVILDVGLQSFARSHLAQLQSLMEARGLELWTVLAEEEATREAARSLGLATRLPGSNRDLEGNVLGPVTDEAPAASERSESPVDALFLRETLRSGRSIYHEGHVIIIGDVNPGAEVIAGGDVIVWGRLRGLVHAGALGDESAIICALELTPTQLRIASQIAIPPDERQGDPVPETASIRNGQIVADPWRLRE
ncbi:MAG: septum site-determining protein MinC [Candidatus Promineifilaceae bacterium]|nr:septum site-determining protein MinC [Candidatus Promineifilaceae bacterium]